MKDVSILVAKTFAVVMVVVTSAPLIGQQAGAAASQSASAGAGAAQASESSQAVAVADLRPVSGELEGKLDSKSAKVGDRVVVKTKAAMNTATGTAIPKGTRLVGHITDVQAHGSGNADSRIAIQFDRAEFKGGQTLAIHSVIQSVEPPVDLAAASAQSDGSQGAGPVGGGGRASGGRGGGLVGGVANTASGATSGLGSTVGGAARTTGDVAGNATSGVGTSVHAVTGVSGGVVAHSTGVPGVSLSSEATGSASGTLFASKKNVHLDDGTLITLGVAADASAR